MASALGWGALAASSLVVGALLGLLRPWPDRGVGIVLAFGAGALISAVSFDLAQQGVELAGGDAVALGLGGGALTFFVADRAIQRRDRRGRDGGPESPEAETGSALALGALLDGIPEQMVLGIGLATGDGVSIGLLAAIFISNLPEAVGSAAEMRITRPPAGIARMWVVVALVCTFAAVVGYGIAETASDELRGTIHGFAAGALLVMLIDAMIPDATHRAGDVAGLATVFGFALAAGLSSLT